MAADELLVARAREPEVEGDDADARCPRQRELKSRRLRGHAGLEPEADVKLEAAAAKKHAVAAACLLRRERNLAI